MRCAALALACLAGAALAGPTPRVVSVAYEAWNEAIEVDLRSRRISTRRTEHTYESPVSGNPTSSRTVPGPERRLSRRRVDSLRRLVTRGGFLTLAPACGAPEGERFYPYRVKVGFADGTTREVLYRSNPSYEGAPAPFTDLVDRLRELAKGP